MQTLLQLLAKNPAFVELNQTFCDVLVSCASPCSFAQDEVIFKTGEPANQFFLIEDGRVRLTAHSPHKGPLHIMTLECGDVLGWSWLFPPYTWHFDATAVQQSHAFQMDGACVRDHCESDHEFGYKLLRCFSQIMLQRLLATRLQLLDLYGEGPDPTNRTET